jgi:TIR domain-containing protein
MIFISYAREDRELIQGMIDHLAYALTLNVWTDSNIRIGTSFTHSIQKELDQAWIVIVAWTHNSVNSEFVTDEARRAHSRGKLFPVRLEDIEPPPGFGILQTLDLTGYHKALVSNGDTRAALDSLVHEIISYIPKHIDLPFLLRLNRKQSRELEIARRLSQERRIALVCGRQESLAALPFHNGLNMLGFSATFQPEPEEASGQNMNPLLDEIRQADLTIFLLFPTTMSRWFFEACHRTANSRVCYLLFGSLTIDWAKRMYPFLSNEPDEKFLGGRRIGFPLSGKAVVNTWTTIRFIIERSSSKQH